MFIINIAVKENISPAQHESLFIQHVEWFKRHFATENFVIVGPYTDQERSGVIIANIASRDELMAVLAEDAYYPDLAIYAVREFSPKMIAENLHQFQAS